MKNLLFALALLPLSLSAQQDTVYLFEGFDYADYNGLFNLDGGSEQGWISPWSRLTGDDAILRRGNLEAPEFNQAEDGTHTEFNFVRAGMQYARQTRRFRDEGQEIWLSAVMDWRPGSAANNIGNITLTRGGDQGITFGRRFGNRRIAIILPGGVVFDTDVQAEGVHTLLMKIEMSGDSGNELAYLWVDPDFAALGADPDVATADARTPAGRFNLNRGIDGVLLRAEGTPPLNMAFDRFVMGGSVTSVGPASPVSSRAIVKPNLTLSAFPNPSSGQLTLQWDQPVTDRVQVRLFDIRGTMVLELPTQEFAPGPRTQQVNLGERELPAGTYLAYLRGSGSYGYVRVILR